MAVKKWRGKKGKRTYAVCPMSERGGKCRLAPYAFCGISCFLHMRQSQIISRTYAPHSPCVHAHIFFGADNRLFCRVRAYKPPAPLSIFNGVKKFFIYVSARVCVCAHTTSIIPRTAFFMPFFSFCRSREYKNCSAALCMRRGLRVRA